MTTCVFSVPLDVGRTDDLATRVRDAATDLYAEFVDGIAGRPWLKAYQLVAELIDDPTAVLRSGPSGVLLVWGGDYQGLSDDNGSFSDPDLHILGLVMLALLRADLLSPTSRGVLLAQSNDDYKDSDVFELRFEPYADDVSLPLARNPRRVAYRRMRVPFGWVRFVDEGEAEGDLFELDQQEIKNSFGN